LHEERFAMGKAFHAVIKADLIKRYQQGLPDAGRRFEELMMCYPTAPGATGHAAPAGAEQLLTLYRGTFLKEDEGERWSVTTRERLKSRFIHALGVETARLEREGRFDLAIESYLRGIDADPVIEPFYQGLMRCYASSGRRAEAVAVSASRSAGRLEAMV
jgi:hypothetical protein